MRFFDKKDLVIAFLLGCLLFASLGWTVSHDWSQVRNVNVTENNIDSSLLDELSPPGAVMAFATPKCPDGWIKADGSNVSKLQFSDLNKSINMSFGGNDTHFTLPDLRGIFIRGEGENSMIKKADGNNFVASFADYQNDAFQGHETEQRVSFGWSARPEVASNGRGRIVEGSSHNNNAGASSSSYASVTTSGLFYADTFGNGDPRVGSETRSVNIALTYCIKS